MVRGIEKRKVSWADEDRRDFFARLAAQGEEKGMDIYGPT
jgi:hypothetical protein